MRFVVQVTSEASVTIEGETNGAIKKGSVVLIGIEDADTTEIADKMIKKLLGLRIFPDENGKTNLNLEQVGCSLLLISQFTLYADCRHGYRPSFTGAGAPDHAKELYEYIIAKCRESGIETQTGRFGADMQVKLVNEGPFTLIMDSKELA